MFWWDLLVILLIAALITVVFPVGLRRGHVGRPGAGVAFFFLIVFLAAWVGSIWIIPLGPVVGGVYIWPILMMALFAALMLTAFSTGHHVPRTRAEAVREAAEEREAERAFDIFFWIFLVFLITLVVIGFFMPQTI